MWLRMVAVRSDGIDKERFVLGMCPMGKVVKLKIW